MAADPVAAAATALRSGGVVLVPTDGVYGLCASPYREADVRALYALKGRDDTRPAAILAASVELLLDCVPELRGRAALIARALLPGPYTLVLPNPARRFRWLAGSNPDAIGVRVARLPPPAAALLDALGAVAATSANLPGGRDPASLAQVPAQLRAGCAAELDAGTLPGVPSTVIDFSGAEPALLRLGAGPLEPALAAARAALAG